MTPRTRTLWRLTGLDLARDRATWTALIGLALVSLVASIDGIREVSAVRTAIADAHALATEKLATAKADGAAILAGARPRPPYWLNPADVRGFAYHEMVAFVMKPPSPIAPLSLGSIDVLPSYVRVLASSATPFAQAYELENPHRLALGRLDPAFVVIYVLPLVLAALGHHALARERDSGRLGLLMVHGVTLRQLVGVRLTLCGLLAVVVCVICLVAPVWVSNGGAGGLRLALWCAVLVAYAALWLAAIAVVVATTSRQAMAAAVLGALWVTATLVAPWTLAAAAESIFPSPSRVEQILQERASLEAVEAGGAAAINRYVTEHPEMGVAAAEPLLNAYTSRQIVFNAALERRIAANDRALEQQLEKRQALVDSFSWAVPSVLATEAMVDLSGTGWRRHRAFLQQGHEYVGRLRAFFDPRALRGELEFREWDASPRFSWQEPPARPALARAAAASAGLVALACALALWASWRLEQGYVNARRGES